MPRTCPVGLLGLLTHSSFGVADESVGPAGLMSLRLSIGWGVAPASLVPTSYVGYARAGNPTTSPRPAPSRVGSQATSSLLPRVGRTASGFTSGTPRRRANHAATASRRTGVPHVCG